MTRTRAASVQVSTSQYQFSHGRMPRGTGTWAFRTRTSDWQFYSGSYTTCRAQAVAFAQDRDEQWVEVGS